MKTRRAQWHIFVFYVATASIVLALAACAPSRTGVATEAPPTESAAVQPTGEAEPTVLRVGWIREPDCMHSYYLCATLFYFAPDLIHETLKAWGPGCETIPQLAESYEYSDDGYTVTIHVREGLTWNDGEPLTATDISEFFDFVQRLDIASWHTTTAYAESWEVVDEHTFQFTNSITLSPEALEAGPSVWDFIVPPQIYSELDEEAFWEYSTDEPVTAGPYTLTEWNRGSYMIFDARPDYWAGKLPVDRIIVQFYDNTDALVGALLGDEIDMIPKDILPEYLDELSSDPRLQIVEQAPGPYLGLFFNLFEGGNVHPAIQDPRVREAIDYAIDRQQIIDVALLGKGQLCPLGTGCGPHWERWLDPSIEATPYDPAVAAQILDEAGYVDGDGDGIRESPEGEPLAFRFYFIQDFPPALTTADIVSDNLSAVGIQAETEAVEEGALFSLALYDHDYDMMIILDTGEIDPGTDDWQWGCWSAEGGAGNFSGYCSPEMDEAIFQILTTNGPERIELTQREQRILIADRPNLFLAGVNAIGAYRSDKFEIPNDACSYWLMLLGTYPLMNTTVK